MTLKELRNQVPETAGWTVVQSDGRVMSEGSDGLIVLSPSGSVVVCTTPFRVVNLSSQAALLSNRTSSVLKSRVGPEEFS